MELAAIIIATLPWSVYLLSFSTIPYVLVIATLLVYRKGGS